MKITVLVRSGCVESVYASEPASVQVVDLDHHDEASAEARINTLTPHESDYELCP